MKEMTFFKLSSLVLLLLNLALIGLTYSKDNPKRNHHKKPSQEVARSILDLDDQQHADFLRMAHDHFEKMKTFDSEQREVLKKYFEGMRNELPTPIIDSLLTQCTTVERKKIRSTYAHLMDIKSILRDDQMPRFKEFEAHALRLILGSGKRPPPREIRK